MQGATSGAGGAMQPLSSNYAAVKNYLEAEQSKRKQLDSQVGWARRRAAWRPLSPGL